MASAAMSRSNISDLDTSVPHPARRYNYWLGGKDNFAADRISGDEIAAIWPPIRTAVWENRKFLRRAVTYAARERGIRQFLDIGTGLPTAENTHEVAQRIDPTCRIVYVDNDPHVLVHARALLTSTPEGKTAYVDADVRDPERILQDGDLKDTIDLRQPVALMLVALLHFLPDSDNPYAVVDAYKNALAPDSLLVLSHGSYDLMETEPAEILRSRGYSGADFYGRTRKEVEDFFDGMEIVGSGKEPSLVSEWNRNPEVDGEAPDPKEVSFWGGVGLKT